MLKGYGSTGSSNPLLDGGGVIIGVDYSEGKENSLLPKGGFENVPILPSSSSPASVQTLSIPRATFLFALNRRAERAAHCRYVPIAILTYCVACYLIILHGHVPASASIASTLIEQVVNAGGNDFRTSVTTRNSWVDYYAGAGVSAGGSPPPNEGWLASVLSQLDNGVVINDLNMRGRVADFNHVIGGVLIAQTRRSQRDCTLQSIRSIYGVCSDGALSLDRFGPANINSARYQITLPSDGTSVVNIQAAFNASTSRDKSATGEGASLFQWTLDAAALSQDNQALAAGLDAAGWLDQLTSTISVETVFLNGESGYIARLAMFSIFTPGGRAVNTVKLSVFPADFYALYPQLLVLDTLAVFYWVYLFFAIAQRTARDLKRKRPCSEICSFFRIADLGAVVSLLTAIIQFSRLNYAVKNLGIDPNGVARDYQDGTTTVAGAVINAAKAFDSFKNSLVWVLAFLTIRVYYYMTFQPRLAAFIVAFTAVGVDLFHYGIIVGVALTFIGVWGHFYFGTLAPDWSSISGSFVSVIRMAVYDYDLIAMEAVRRGTSEKREIAYCYLRSSARAPRRRLKTSALTPPPPSPPDKCLLCRCPLRLHPMGRHKHHVDCYSGNHNRRILKRTPHTLISPLSDQRGNRIVVLDPHNKLEPFNSDPLDVNDGRYRDATFLRSDGFRGR